MSNLPDLFPSFATKTVQTKEADIFVRIGGEGPPLLMLHGYPQTHVMWHKVAAELAKYFTCVIADLRGYGQSSVPDDTPDHYSYSKRAMARDNVELMSQLGYDTFSILSHDRGARVSYRLALDFPEKLERLAIFDIVPTYELWHGLTPALAHKTFHWTFLAQQAPWPENMIGIDPIAWLDRKISGWSAKQDLSSFDPLALAHYRDFFARPERLHATCEDYRAGATYDLKADEKDRETGLKISCPMLILWGKSGIPSKGSSPLDIWKNWADNVQGQAVNSGHFLAEENPEETLKLTLPFLKGE